MNLSVNIALSDFLNAYCLMFGIDHRSFHFSFNAQFHNPKDNRKIKDIFTYENQIIFFGKNLIINYDIGKKIIAKSKIDGKIVERPVYTLNSTKVLFDYNGFGYFKKNIKKIIIGKIIIEKEKENCLSFLGIKDNFNCLLEY